MPAIFMREFNLFALALRNLKRKKFRTGILVFSIALLVSILVFGLFFVTGVRSGIERSADRLGADLLVVPVGARGHAEEVLLEARVKAFYMDKGVVEKVKQIKGIETVTYQTYLTTIQGVCCDIPEATVVAFNQDTDFIVGPWLERSIGRRLGKNEAIVGYESFLNIGLGLMDVNANLFGIRFKIIGSLEKSGTGLDNAIFVSDENIGEIIHKGKSPLKEDQISIIFTKVRDGYDPRMVGRQIEGDMIDVDVTTRSDMGQDILATLKDINHIFLITIILASLLSVFLAWAIFSAIANERLREVGIMRAIGAKESHIVRLFFTEVLTIGAIGSTAGIVIGICLSIFLSKGFILLRDVSVDLTTTQQIGISIIALIIGVMISILGALSPLYRLKSLEPATAIKEG
jgi:putative ABC transport system permease protein